MAIFFGEGLWSHQATSRNQIFTVGIQSPSENGFMEPKYYSFQRWWRTPWSSSEKLGLGFWEFFHGFRLNQIQVLDPTPSFHHGQASACRLGWFLGHDFRPKFPAIQVMGHDTWMLIKYMVFFVYIYIYFFFERGPVKTRQSVHFCWTLRMPVHSQLVVLG